MQAARAAFLDDAVRPEHHHRLLDGLTADAEPGGQFLLDEMRAGREVAVANGVEDRLIHLIDRGLTGWKLAHSTAVEL